MCSHDLLYGVRDVYISENVVHGVWRRRARDRPSVMRGRERGVELRSNIRCPRCVRTCDHAYCLHLWCELNMQTSVLLPVINSTPARRFACALCLGKVSLRLSTSMALYACHPVGRVAMFCLGGSAKPVESRGIRVRTCKSSHTSMTP